MLSKNNKILIGCLALLLVMSVGYALFSDTITVNGTATAKGEFDMTATCQTGIPSVIESVAYGYGVKVDGGYKNDSCEVVDDKVSLKTDFLYPGAKRNFTVKITNTGTIDALYDSSKLTVAEELCVADDLEGNNLTCNNIPTTWGTVEHKGYNANFVYRYITLEKPNGNLLSQSELLEFYDPSTGNVIIKPGYSAYIVCYIFINHVSDAGTTGEMNVSYSSSIDLPFVQATN